MRIIHRFPIGDKKRFILYLVPESRLIHLDRDEEGKFCVWIESPFNNNGAHPVHFEIFDTGQLIPECSVYWGTLKRGPFVQHLYEHLTGISQ